MRRIIGPIVTTGVALVASGVVVANPLIASHADIRIPAVQLSGTSDATGMLDQSFLDAIAPAAPESTNPFSVLKQLVSSLAGDATSAGKNAIVHAFVAGITASAPELTAVSVPYVAVPAADLSALAGFVVPGGLDPAAVFGPPATLPATLPDPASFVAQSVAPVVGQFVTTLTDGASAIGGELVAAAFSLGTVVANEPKMIVETLVALVHGDFKGALEKAVEAITAPLGPPTMIVDAIRNFFDQLPGPAPAAPTVLTNVQTVTPQAPAAATDSGTADAAPVTSQRHRTRAQTGVLLSTPVLSSTPVLPSTPAATPLPASAVEADISAVVPDPTVETSTPAEPPAAVKAAPARKAARDSVKSVAEQVGSAVRDVAGAVGKAVGRSHVGQSDRTN